MLNRISLYCQNNRHHRLDIDKILSCSPNCNDPFIYCVQECPPMDNFLKNYLTNKNYLIIENTLEINYNLPRNGSTIIVSPQLRGMVSPIDLSNTPGLTSAILLPSLNLVIVNVYAPYTTQDRGLIQRVIENLSDKNYEIIMVGDFNTQLTPFINQPNAVTKYWPWLKNLITNGIFIDTLGSNPSTNCPTRIAKNSPHSRLDYIFVISSLIPYLHNFKSEVLNAPNWSDHKTLLMSWELDIPNINIIRNSFIKCRKLTREELIQLEVGLKPLNNFLEQINIYVLNQSQILRLVDKIIIELISQFRVILNQLIYRTSHNPLTPKPCQPSNDYFDKIGGRIDRSLLKGEKFNNIIKPFMDNVSSYPFTNYDQYHNYTKMQFLEPVVLPFPDDIFRKRYSASEEKISLSINLAELDSILSNSPPNLACGPEGVNCFMLSCLPLRAKIVVLMAINMSFTHNYPTSWNDFRVTLLQKTNVPKGPKDFRPISIVNSFQKIRSSIILKHLTKWTEKLKVLSPNQHGFRCNYSTLEPILKVANMMTPNYYMKIIDINKAYDSVPLKCIFKALLNMGVPGTLVFAIREHYNNANAIPVINGVQCNKVKVDRGLRQGCCLSPILYNLYTNEILKIINDKYAQSHSTMLAYADDRSLADQSNVFGDVKALDALITVAVDGDNFFFDGATSISMTNLPKYHRVALCRPQQRIITDETPAFVFKQ